jgi:helix-turn-helix protein
VDFLIHREIVKDALRLINEIFKKMIKQDFKKVVGINNIMDIKEF